GLRRLPPQDRGRLGDQPSAQIGGELRPRLWCRHGSHRTDQLEQVVVAGVRRPHRRRHPIDDRCELLGATTCRERAHHRGPVRSVAPAPPPDTDINEASYVAVTAYWRVVKGGL